VKRVLFVVLLFAGTVAIPVPAQAAVCSGTSGVSVIVQFPDGHIETGCAPGDPANGIQALTGAGFTYDPVPGQQGATVCHINGQPAAGEKCWQPPDYWAYFYAQRGGEWTYSTYGPGNRDPKPGTVEGWKFGGSATNKPSMAPPGSPASTPTAHPTTSHPTSVASNPVVKPTTTGHPTAGTTPTAPDATANPDATGTPTSGPSSSSTDPGAPAADWSATGGVATEDVARQVPDAKAATNSKSWIWGLVLIGAIGAGAGTIAIRRRRA